VERREEMTTITGDWCNRVKMSHMKRQLIALGMILAIGLQGSLVTFAAPVLLMQSDCQTSARGQHAADKSCCPSVHTRNCCADACPAAAAVAIAFSPTSLICYSRSAPALRLGTSFFLSRGDTPLIRPPIL
jgi:hypothetical protein